MLLHRTRFPAIESAIIIIYLINRLDMSYYPPCWRLFTAFPLFLRARHLLELQLPSTIAVPKATNPPVVRLNSSAGEWALTILRRENDLCYSLLKTPTAEAERCGGSCHSCLALSRRDNRGLPMWFTVAGSKKAEFEMGGSGSANRGVSFSLDEDAKVTVIEGVKVHVTASYYRYEPCSTTSS